MARSNSKVAPIWTDYSSRLIAGEEIAAAVVDQILTDGGTALWQKYLERKAFGFASEVVTEAMVSQLRMCFVSHDPGEEEGEEVWDLEDEPEPGNIDSWARMHLQCRHRATGSHDGPQGAGSSNRNRSTGMGATARSNQGNRSLRSNEARMRPAAQTPGASEKRVEIARAQPLKDPQAEDVEEKRLRDAKAQEEVRRRDRQRRQREAEQVKEDEQRKVEELHKEMERRQHTFDTNGDIIWVDEIKLDRLPKVQETAGFQVKKDPKSRVTVEEPGGRTVGSTSAGGRQDATASKDEPVASKNSRHARGKRDGKRPRVVTEPEFSDSYSKLQYGQPPILDTMSVQQGVILDMGGKKKHGLPDTSERAVMSRKEYNLLAEQEMSNSGYGGGGHGGGHGAGMGGHAAEAAVGTPQPAAAAPDARRPSQGRADGGNGGTEPAGAAPGGSPAAAAAAPSGAGGGGGGAASGGGPSSGGGGQGGGASKSVLPPLRGASSQGGRSSSKPKDKDGDPGAPPLQRAPPAPPRETRHPIKKWEALGDRSSAPRYHVPRLGGSSGMTAAQPPLGATMGHGLVRHGSLKEEYFFPPSMQDFALPLQRSISEAGLGGSRGGTPKGGNTPNGFNSEVHGQLRKEEMSPAYRNFRSQLLGEAPQATTVGGGFGGRSF